MTLKKGDTAPAFSLFSSEKEQINLEDYKGKNVVILFFPLAFTSVCTEELCSIRDELAVYEGFDAEVMAISVDSPMTLAKFKEEQGYNFTLISDFNKEASRSYGALYEDFVLGMRGVSKRAAFVVDKNGTIQYAEVLENAGHLPNFVKVKEALSALIA